MLFQYETDRLILKILKPECALQVLDFYNRDKELFEKTKKSLYGDFVRMFNSVSSIATNFINNYFRGIDTSDYVEAYKTITLEEIKNVIEEHFDFDKLAVSIIECK